MKNKNSLDTICASLANLIGIDAPEKAAAPNPELMEYANSKLSGEKVDRIFMYNPDAIAQWIYEKYSYFTNIMKPRIEVEIPLCTIMPSVTPVCFGTMYTGAQPEVHGIQAYVKPVIKIDTIYDALIRAGKKPAIVSTAGDSMSKIYLERDMDYYIYDTVEEVNAKAAELIVEDKHDLICVYDRNYDSLMHKYGPESVQALAEIKSNSHNYATFNALIKRNWKKHNTLVGFAMDHGCHEIDGGCGSHGLDMPEDINIVHMYKAYEKNDVC